MTKGFTLTELLLATALLAFVLSGLLLVFINCIFLNEASRNLSVAASHAEIALEDMKNTDFGNIVTSFNGTCWDDADLAAKGLLSLNNETVCFSVSGTKALEAQATVNWKDRGTRDRNFALTTIISEP